MRKYALKMSAACLAVVAFAPAAHAQERAGASSSVSEMADGDIVVTARRREESQQAVPVSITAFSGDALQSRTVQTLSDLSSTVPGLQFTSNGGKGSTSLSLRGLGQLPLNDVTPAAVTYFADVPLAVSGSNIPTYDIASVQVLKGPQGTLFGRNTIGGALLVQPETPSYTLGGYVKGTYGRYNYASAEGAINIPLIDGKAALRVAGQIRRQDGRTNNLSGGRDFDNTHQDSFRISLLLEPAENISNKTIFDWFKADEVGGGGYLLRVNEGAIPGLSDFLDPQLLAYRETQRRNFYGAFDDGANPYFKRKIWGITNDTRIDIGALTLRNIFGYRRTFKDELINSSGSGLVTLPGAVFGSPTDIPFTIFDGSALIDRKYITNELQLLGDFDWGNFIVGGFFNRDESVGPNGSQFFAFAPTGSPAGFISAHTKNTNYAVFGQTAIKLTPQVTLNVGARYSWDRVSACGGGSFGQRYVDSETCEQTANLNLVDGVGIARAKGGTPSWTIGLDYQPSDDLLLYIASRRGYRAANVNTPLFESPFTTGGAGCSFGGPVPCPDLRPFQRTGKETVTDGELGAKWDFTAGGGSGRINVAAFYTKYKDALQFANVQALGIPNTAPDAPTNGSVGINAADLTIYGVELEMVFRPSSTFTASFNGAYTHQQVDTIRVPSGTSLSILESDITLPAPTFAGTMAASWTLPFRPADGDLVLSGDLYMTDDFGGQQGRKLPGYMLANARLDWKNIGGSGLSLGAFVRNLTGEHYYAAPIVLLPSFPTNAVYVGEQRTWGVEASYRF